MFKKRKIISLTLFLILFLLSYASEEFVQNTPLPKSTSTQVPSQTILGSKSAAAVVVHVVDGDTIDILQNNEKVRIRLLGINTPETVDPRKQVQCFGKQASGKVEELLMNQSVTLVSDVSQGDKDKYGRLLRYVYLEDGTFVNEYLIAEGFAYEYTYDAPYLYQKKFKEAQKRAESEKRGLWGIPNCSLTPIP